MIFGFLAILTLEAVPQIQSLNTPTEAASHRESAGSSLPGITGEQPSPTLAPPRGELLVQEGRPARISLKGKPIFLHIETDDNEIEISWASP
jgi:hypothetical protein